jgi:type III pantothenate kinase
LVAEFGLAGAVSGLDELLAVGVEAVAIFTPRHTHAALALQAMQAGAHVYIAVPAAVDLDELKALVAAAAKLPRIAIEAPATDNVIGRTTESQMLIGIYFGYVAMMEGLIARMKAQIGKPVKVVATGGLAPLFQQHAHLFDAIDGDLTLRGLAILYARREGRA